MLEEGVRHGHVAADGWVGVCLYAFTHERKEKRMPSLLLYAARDDILENERVPDRRDDSGATDLKERKKKACTCSCALRLLHHPHACVPKYLTLLL